jgi:hypothetical protein
MGWISLLATHMLVSVSMVICLLLLVLDWTFKGRMAWICLLGLVAVTQVRILKERSSSQGIE